MGIRIVQSRASAAPTVSPDHSFKSRTGLRLLPFALTRIDPSITTASALACLRGLDQALKRPRRKWRCRSQHAHLQRGYRV